MKTIYKSAFGLLFLLSILLVQCKKSNDTPVTPKSSAKTLPIPPLMGLQVPRQPTMLPPQLTQ